jgi:hypothetical protein
MVMTRKKFVTGAVRVFGLHEAPHGVVSVTSGGAVAVGRGGHLAAGIVGGLSNSAEVLRPDGARFQAACA